MSAAAMVIGIGCGLGAALCFGAGDFLAQRLTHRHGWMPAMFAVQLASALLLTLVGAAWHGSPIPAVEDGGLALVFGVIAIGVVNMLGIIGLYRAFETGKLSLVSPIAGSMGAFTVAFAWLAGRPPAAVVIPGLLAVIVGVVAASVVDQPTKARSGPKLRAALGVGWALVSAIAFGWVFLELGPRSVALGSAWTLVIMRVVAIAALLMLARPMRARLDAALRTTTEQPSSRARVVAVAGLDSLGLVLFAYGSSRGAVIGEAAVVAVLSSSFPVVTVALARVWLREALRWWQWVGVALVIAGVAWVSGAA